MTKIINIETDKYTLAELLAIVRGGDEVIVQEANMPVLHITEPVSSNVVSPKKPFVFGLAQRKYQQAETVFWMSDNFDDELPMSFWLGEDA